MKRKNPSSSRPEATDSPPAGPVVVSACLLGVECRYDGRSKGSPCIIRFAQSARVIAVCPEQLGGLSTPRPPADIVGGDGHDVLSGRARVVNRMGEDVTGAFVKGAEEALRLARESGAETALLKDRSPSCGLRTPYCDKTTGYGPGVTAALFRRSGIRVLEIRPGADFPPPDFDKEPDNPDSRKSGSSTVPQGQVSIPK